MYHIHSSRWNVHYLKPWGFRKKRPCVTVWEALQQNAVPPLRGSCVSDKKRGLGGCHSFLPYSASSWVGNDWPAVALTLNFLPYQENTHPLRAREWKNSSWLAGQICVQLLKWWVLTPWPVRTLSSLSSLLRLLVCNTPATQLPLRNPSTFSFEGPQQGRQSWGLKTPFHQKVQFPQSSFLLLP